MHRGAFVNALDARSVRDHYELFGLVYGFAAGFAGGWGFAELRNGALLLSFAVQRRRAQLGLLKRLFEFI